MPEMVDPDTGPRAGVSLNAGGLGSKCVRACHIRSKIMIRGFLLPLLGDNDPAAFFKPLARKSHQIGPGTLSHFRARAGSRYPVPVQGEREKARRRRQAEGVRS